MKKTTLAATAFLLLLSMSMALGQELKVSGEVTPSPATQETLDALVASFEGVEGKAELKLKVEKEDGAAVIEEEEVEGTLTAEQELLWEQLKEQAVADVAAAEGDDVELEIEIEHELELEDEEEGQEEEVEIEAEISGGKALVEVEQEFKTAAEGEALVDEILERFSLDADTAEALLKVEQEDEEKEEDEEEKEGLTIEIEREEGVTEVEVELRFMLDAVERDIIVAAVVERTQLARSAVELALALEEEEETEEAVDEAAVQELADDLSEEELAELEEGAEEAELEAEETAAIEAEDPGAVSGLGWQTKRFFERINVALTLRAAAKADKELQFARRRALEARKAALAGNEEAAERLRQAHEEAVARFEERFGDEDTRGLLIAREKLREHLATVKAANRGLETDRKILEEKLEERITARLERAREKLEAAEVDDVDEELERLKVEVREKIDSRGSEAERLGRLAEHVEEKIADGRERLAEAEPETEEDEEKLAAATESLDRAERLLEEGRTAIAEENFDEAKEKLLQARKLAMAPLIRSRLHAAAVANVAVVKERLQEEEKFREKLAEHKVEVRQRLEKISDGEELTKEELRERLRVKGSEVRAEVRERRASDDEDTEDDDGADETRAVERVRIRTPGAEVEREVKTRSKDGEVETEVKERVRESSTDDEESSGESSGSGSGSDSTGQDSSGSTKGSSRG